jgi:hypothetical protein
LVVVRLGQGLVGDPVLEEVEQQEQVAALVGRVELEALVVLKEVELALSADLEALVDLGRNAEALETSGPRVGRVQSNCIGILEACPPPQ